MRPGPSGLAVVGGGVMGLCVALDALGRDPSLGVTVVDRTEAGAGASRHAPGIQVSIGRSAPERDLARRGQSAWASLFPGGSYPTGRSCDLFWLTSEPGRLADWHIGPQLGPASGDGWRRRLGGLPDPVVPAGVSVLRDRCSYSPVAGVVGVLRERLRRAGCAFVDGFEVEQATPSADGVRLTDRRGRSIEAACAVIAVGPWLPSSGLAADALPPSRPRTKKVVSLHLDRAPAPDSAALALQDDYAFLMPMVEEGYWLFSFTSQQWDVEPDADALRVDDDDVRRGSAILARWFPRQTPGVASSRVFCDCYPADGLPFARRSPGQERVAVIGGGSGNGFRFAPPIAEDGLDLVWPFCRPGAARAGRAPGAVERVR